MFLLNLIRLSAVTTLRGVSLFYIVVPDLIRDPLASEVWRITGPGIDGEASLGIAPLLDGLTAQLQDNQAGFRLDADLIFAGPTQIAALRRSSRIEGAP